MPASPVSLSVLVLMLSLFPVSPQTLPSWIPVHDAVAVSSLAEEAWGEVAVPGSGAAAPTAERGRRWSFTLRLSGLPEDAPASSIFGALRPLWTTAGWGVTRELKATPEVVVLSRVAAGQTAWAVMTLFGPSDVRVEVVEVGPQPLSFALPSPGQSPEALVSLDGPIPFLPPLPGSRLIGGGWNDDVLKFKMRGSDELTVVGKGYLGRHYQGPPPGLSNVQFFTVYRDALVNAGWRVVDARQHVNAGDATLVAHYTAKGRDLWAYLHADGGEYSIDVADVGQDDLATQLREGCRAPLYGVLFDVDKATVTPESDAVLTRAVAALTAAGSTRFEVQGHTDNVGTDAHNDTLSDARARAVMQWFIAKGIPAGRLTSKGYGERQPVADNNTDAGRAKNRRVELACATP